MLIILGGLAGLMLAPSPALATFPMSVQLLAGLFAAGPFSWFMGRYGRKAGFLTGGGFACVGGVVGTLALFQSSFILLCLSHIALGAALACYQYFRFAAAEAVSEEWQPVAISLMLTSGLIAAFAGPQIFISAKDVFDNAPLAGAYTSISIFTLLGLLPLAFVRLETHRKPLNKANKSPKAGLAVLLRGPVLTAVIIGAISQAIMVLLMAPTPLAMIGHGFSEATAGDVIRWHVVAMFAPSFFTGFLIKRFGTRPIVTLGLIVLIASTLIAASGLSPHHFYGSLILLGIGWNFGFIGATNMLAKALSAEERPLVQGTNDTIIALASTICAFAAGAIVANFSWTVLSLAALPILGVGLISVLLFGPKKPVA